MNHSRAPLPEKVSLEFFINFLSPWLEPKVKESPSIFLKVFGEYLEKMYPYGLMFSPHKPIVFYENWDETADLIYGDGGEPPWLDSETFNQVVSKEKTINLSACDSYIGVYSKLVDKARDHGLKDSGIEFLIDQKEIIHSGTDSYYLEVSDDLHGWAVFEKRRLPNVGLQYKALEFLELRFDQVFMNRDNFKAFEQENGFFDHGLPPKQIRKLKKHTLKESKTNQNKENAKSWRYAAVEIRNNLISGDRSFKRRGLFADAIAEELNKKDIKNANGNPITSELVQSYLSKEFGDKWSPKRVK